MFLLCTESSSIFPFSNWNKYLHFNGVLHFKSRWRIVFFEKRVKENSLVENSMNTLVWLTLLWIFFLKNMKFKTIKRTTMSWVFCSSRRFPFHQIYFKSFRQHFVISWFVINCNLPTRNPTWGPCAETALAKITFPFSCLGCRDTQHVYWIKFIIRHEYIRKYIMYLYQCGDTEEIAFILYDFNFIG